MSIDNEPQLGGESFGFKIPESMEQSVAGIGNAEIRQNFIDAVKNDGLESAMAVSPAYIQGIEAKFRDLAERSIDDNEKQALQLLERVLPQIALAEMLHAADEDDEVSGVLDDVYTMLNQEIDGIDPPHQEYFQALLRLV